MLVNLHATLEPRIIGVAEIFGVSQKFADEKY